MNAIVWRSRPDDRKEVVVDAAGYRERRRAALESLAVRSAEEALATHSRVELEPMTAVERKTVHVRLKEFDGVETGSEGTEPNRYVVIYARRLTDPRLERWLDALLATPGLTAIDDRDEAWAMLVDDALRGVEVVRGFDGPIVDVGSGERLARDPARGCACPTAR